uniref:HAT C-terminal dimerisation domain-containing protein n=1 Tax=Brassica oleracea var. oleracea TaxID=109376 RepID=A0A0D3EEH2_BRAOL
MVSKKLQDKTICIDNAMKQVAGVMSYFEKYRNDGFSSSINMAKDLAHEMDIDAIFPKKRRCFRKKQFDEANHEEVSLFDEAMTPIQVLELVKDMGCYPNVDIAYRILLTTPVTVASAERSFSKLKLVIILVKKALHRLSSPFSAKDQAEAAGGLCSQTERFNNVRAFFVAEIPDSITRLLTPLSSLGEEVDSNLELQENIVTTLLYISSIEQNRTAVAQNPLVIPQLTKSLKQGTDETRRTSAVTHQRSHICSFPPLFPIGDQGKGGFRRFDSRSDQYDQIKKICGYAVICLDNVGLTQRGALEEIDDIGFIDDLFSILRNPSCSVTCEVALAMGSRVLLE